MEEFSDLYYEQEEDMHVDDYDEDTFFMLFEGFDIADGNLSA